MVSRKPLVLVILDGWGYREDRTQNAIAHAHTPHWDAWWATCPHSLLDASGPAVGLPDKQMGNSEVGHMHIGSGRVIPQDFTRINDAIATGEFANNPVFLQLIQQVKTSGKRLHIMGLLSPGGVHSHEKHLFAFLELCHQKKLKSISLHLFLDGRDVPPQSALESIAALNAFLQAHPVATIDSICGRYYAMDRDHRWDRTARLYQELTEKQPHLYFADAQTAIKAFYAENKTDEFIPPTRIGAGHPIQDGDSVFFFNFRADRTRQLTEAFLLENFMGFVRPHAPVIDQFVSMTHYANYLPTVAAFPPLSLSNTLGEIIAQEGLSQLRIAETEKYAHVTFFFNGGSEKVFPNEDRLLIPSPHVATYDLKPEMSAPELTRVLIDALKSDAYDVIICNYANADMVGHSGRLEATVAAIECLDYCLKNLWEAVADRQGIMAITADHGNAETMYDESTHQAHTAHTCSPVPFLIVGSHYSHLKPYGSLIDIAPTLLTLLTIAPPAEMTGSSLLHTEESNA